MVDEQQPGRLVPIGEAILTVGRTSEVDLCLRDPTVSRRHATVQRQGEKFIVEDLQSRFGTFINGQRIQRYRATPGDRLQFGVAARFRIEENGLREDHGALGLRLEANGFDLLRAGDRKVQGVRFTVEADAFVGILGPSGSGKSTLLNCLAGFLEPTNGTVKFDSERDAWEEPEDYRALLGYVPQKDDFPKPQEVREIITFATRLRYGASVTDEEVQKQMNKVAECLGLTDYLGNLNVSGGQAKRVSVALELVKRPKLLLLDEPTSALDPAGEANLMHVFRRVAQQGTTVICTTHKVDNIRLFDQVIVLGVRKAENEENIGEVAYVGPPGQLLAKFECRTFADLFEKLGKGDFEPWSPNDAERAIPSRDREEPLNRPTDVTPATRNSSDCKTTSAIVQARDAVASEDDRQQFWLLMVRSATMLRRDPGLLLVLVSQPILLGALVALTQFRANMAGPVLFFAAVIAIWLGLNNSVRGLVSERPIFVRERLAGLRPGSYFVSKIVLYSMIGVVQLILLQAVLFAVGRVTFAEDTIKDLPLIVFPWHFLVLFLTYLGGLAMGFCASAAARTEEQAVAAIPLMIMPQLLISAVATGYSQERFSVPRPFRPLAVTLQADESYGYFMEGVVDVASFTCISRPATLLLELPDVRGYTAWSLTADFCHLMILLLASWTIAVMVFQHRARRWSEEVGFA